MFLLGLVLATPALAQTDAEAVEAALFEMYERLNDSDATYTAFGTLKQRHTLGPVAS